MICTVESCCKPRKYRLYCNAHYHRLYRKSKGATNQTPLGKPIRPINQRRLDCSRPGCHLKTHAHGLCNKHAKYYIKWRDHLSWERIWEIVDNPKCEACGTEKNAVIDHDHRTGKYRGVLCSKCNVALGMLGDDPDRILSLWRYLDGK